MPQNYKNRMQKKGPGLESPDLKSRRTSEKMKPINGLSENKERKSDYKIP